MTGIIYGKTIKVAKDKLQKIVADYALYKNVGIRSQYEIKDKMVIELANGDVWQALLAHKANTCGRRCNIVCIDSNIDDEDLLIDMRITACVPPFQGIHYYYGQE